MDSSTVKFYTTIMVHTRFEDGDIKSTCTDGIPSHLTVPVQHRRSLSPVKGKYHAESSAMFSSLELKV